MSWDVAFVYDLANLDGTLGGAELTMGEFSLAAPEGVTWVAVDELAKVREAETVVVGNCTRYGMELVPYLQGKRVIRYFHDVDPHSHPELRTWFLANAECVFTSPLHRERFPWEPTKESRLIPPALDLGRFRACQNGHKRSGAVSVAAWMNPGKAPHLAAEWAAGNGGIDFYGGGPCAPEGSSPLSYDEMPSLLSRYRTFVFLPTAVEPFGRTVVEAWASGCRVVTNSLVGARYWITKEPDKLDTAADDFWELVLNG